MFKYHLLVNLELGWERMKEMEMEMEMEREGIDGRVKIENDFYMHFLYYGIKVFFRILLR